MLILRIKLYPNFISRYCLYFAQIKSCFVINFDEVTCIFLYILQLPKEDEILPQKLREETRALFLQRRSRQLLDNNELKALWVLLDKHHSPSLSGEEQLINYEDFKKVGKLAGAKCSPYFTAVVFAKLQQGDPHGRISILALFNYVMRKVWLHQTRIGLSLYDVTGQGYLRESVSFLEI